MTDLVALVNGKGVVSSKVIAEKFGKRHDNVIRAINNLKKEMSSDFQALCFESLNITRENAIGKKFQDTEHLLSRDGFTMLVMGFTGKKAIAWREKFILAFNQMEKTIAAELPTLKATIARLEAERKALPASKRPHHLTGTILVAAPIDTLYGPDVEYRRVSREDERYSEMSRIEGRIAHLSSCMEGMSRSISELTKKASKERRK